MREIRGGSLLILCWGFLVDSLVCYVCVYYAADGLVERGKRITTRGGGVKEKDEEEVDKEAILTRDTTL